MNEIIKRSRRSLSTCLDVVSFPTRRIWHRPADAIFGLISLSVILLVVMTYSPTLAGYASRLVAGNKYLALVDGLANPFRNRSLLLQSGLPIYDLKISAKSYAELETVVEEAKSKGWLSEDQKVEVNGRFYHDGKEYDVSVRIRGDLSPHWEGPKKSWRIKFVKQKVVNGTEVLNEPMNFQGKRQINLVLPKDRDFVVAPFVNETMREAGLTVPRDQYVILRINGRMQGLYYEVEHFDEALLASSGRPEATVFGQNDRAMHFEQYTKLGTPITADAKYDVGTVRPQIETEQALGRRSIEELMAFSRNPNPETFQRARDVLDWEKYLNFRAMTTLFNTNHARFGSDNLKLYFDPSRGLLEPIPWDIHLTRMPKEPGTIDFWNAHGPDELQRASILDPQVRLQRNQILWKMVDDGGKRLIDKFADWHNRIRPLAWTDVLTTPIQGEKMDILKKDFDFNVKRVHKVLSHSAANLTFRLQSRNQASIDVASLNFCGVRLHEIKLSLTDVLQGPYQLYEDANANGQVDAGEALIAEANATAAGVKLEINRTILPTPKYGSAEMDGVHWEYFDTLSGRAHYILVGKLAPDIRRPMNWTPPTIVAKATNAVTGTEMASGVINGPTPLAVNSIGILAYDASYFYDPSSPRRSLSEFLAKYPQFVASTNRPGAVELRGKVTIGETVIVPRPVMLLVQPGAEVTMSPGVSIVCYGGLIADGTADQPIRVHGDGKESWGTFAVVRPPEQVILRHVAFSGGDQTQVNEIHFSGAVAIHEGDADVAHCQFTDMKSEDGLNMKKGKVSIRYCEFSGNAADGCDLDHVTGTVKESRFANSGNDGLECSNSVVAVSECRFERNGDKGCSIGDSANPTLVNCLFLGNLIGVSTKDSSQANLAFCTFADNRLAVEGLRKKAFLDGGSGEMVNCVFSNNELLVTEDYFSRGKIQLINSLLDVPTSFSTCRTANVKFQSPDSGDYRLANPEPAGGSAIFEMPAWFHAIEVPADVSAPGIFSSPIDNSEPASSPAQPLAAAVASDN